MTLRNLPTVDLMPETAAAAERSVPGDRRRRRGKIKREVVLATAAALFNEKGFHGTSLDEVAARLGVTKPTIYQYVASKDEILFACVRHGLDRLRQAVDQVPTGHRSGRDRLRAAMHRYAIVMTEDYCRCVTRIADSELSPESRARFRRLKREIDLMLRDLVQRGIEDGSLRPGDARIITFTLTGALNWIGRWYEPGGSMSPEHIASALVATLLQGLEAPA